MLIRITFRPFGERFSDRDAVLLGHIEYGALFDPTSDGFDGSYKAQALVVGGSAELQSHVYTRALADPEPHRLALLRGLLFRRFRAELATWLHDPIGPPEFASEILLTVDDLAAGVNAGPLKRCAFQRATPAGLVCDVELTRSR